jgi:hypothetical protein
VKAENKIRAYFRLLYLIPLLVAGSQAFAWDYPVYDSQDRSRSGIEMERFDGGDSASHTQGWMLGISNLSYPKWTSNFSYGYRFYFGTPRDGGNLGQNNLVYGGLTLGVDGTFGKILTADLTVLGGYGYGSVLNTGLNGESITLQPTVGLGFVLVGGWRLTFNTGYFYMPSAMGFSGWSYGIRLEHKTESDRSHGINN